MNREIKFRAWSAAHATIPGEMLDWQDIQSGDFLAIMTGDFGPDELVLMQFTGLKDKNGVEIYEGDILSEKRDKYKDGAYWPMQHGHHPENARVVAWETFGWHEGFFAGTECLREYLYFGRRGLAPNAEVIGNIYENPELLKNDKGETAG